MSRYTKVLLKFNRARELLKRAAYMAHLPMLPYVVRRDDASDWPGYETHNELHERAARERRLPVKEYIGFDPSSEEGSEMEPTEFVEFEQGWPPSIPTD